jgi:hypothetical protein
MPEPERAVLLERSHAAEDAAILEARHAPPDGLRNFWTGIVDEAEQMAQRGLSEGRSLLDIGVHSRIANAHGVKWCADPSLSGHPAVNGSPC